MVFAGLPKVCNHSKYHHWQSHCGPGCSKVLIVATGSYCRPGFSESVGGTYDGLCYAVVLAAGQYCYAPCMVATLCLINCCSAHKTSTSSLSLSPHECRHPDAITDSCHFVDVLGLLHRYDDLRNYNNERSLYLAQLRDSIEEPWQQWELSHFDVESYKTKTVEEVPSAL